jgi:hypothetical protein
MAARTGQLLFGGRGLNGPRNRMDECCCFPGSSSPRGNSVLSVGGRPGNNSVAPVPVQRQREPEGSIAFPCSDTTSRQHAALEAVYVGLDGRWWTKPAPSPLAGTKMGNVKTAQLSEPDLLRDNQNSAWQDAAAANAVGRRRRPGWSTLARAVESSVGRGVVVWVKQIRRGASVVEEGTPLRLRRKQQPNGRGAKGPGSLAQQGMNNTNVTRGLQPQRGRSGNYRPRSFAQDPRRNKFAMDALPSSFCCRMPKSVYL